MGNWISSMEIRWSCEKFVKLLESVLYFSKVLWTSRKFSKPLDCVWNWYWSFAKFTVKREVRCEKHRWSYENFSLHLSLNLWEVKWTLNVKQGCSKFADLLGSFWSIWKVNWTSRPKRVPLLFCNELLILLSGFHWMKTLWF